MKLALRLFVNAALGLAALLLLRRLGVGGLGLNPVSLAVAGTLGVPGVLLLLLLRWLCVT